MKAKCYLSLIAILFAFSSQSALAQKIGRKDLQIVEGLAGIDARTGFVRIQGEIWNRSSRTVEMPEVIVELFDPAGNPIGVTGFLAEVKKQRKADPLDGVLAERTYLPPGEPAVFEYLRDPNKLAGSRYGSHKLFATARNSAGATPKAAVEGFKYSGGADGFYSVSGAIRNTGSAPCRSPKAVLGFYASDGKLALATSELPQETFQKTIAPGQSVAFSRKSIPIPEGIKIKEIKVWGDCSLPE